MSALWCDVGSWVNISSLATRCCTAAMVRGTGSYLIACLPRLFPITLVRRYVIFYQFVVHPCNVNARKALKMSSDRYSTSRALFRRFSKHFFKFCIMQNGNLISYFLILILILFEDEQKTYHRLSSLAYLPARPP